MQFIADNNNKIMTKLQTVSSDSTHQNGHIGLYQIFNFGVGMKTGEIIKEKEGEDSETGRERDRMGEGR